MSYKVVPFERNHDVSNALQTIINAESKNGFKYVNHEYSDKLNPGTSGCFGIGAKPDTVNHVGFVVFEKE
jgi:hypothetical protein